MSDDGREIRCRGCNRFMARINKFLITAPEGIEIEAEVEIEFPCPKCKVKNFFVHEITGPIMGKK